MDPGFSNLYGAKGQDEWSCIRYTLYIYWVSTGLCTVKFFLSFIQMSVEVMRIIVMLSNMQMIQFSYPCYQAQRVMIVMHFLSLLHGAIKQS